MSKALLNAIGCSRIVWPSFSLPIIIIMNLLLQLAVYTTNC